MSVQNPPTLVAGTRVVHRFATDLHGVIERVTKTTYRIRWDHSGLAFARLGITADLQDDRYVEREQ